MSDDNSNHDAKSGKAWLPISGTALALVVLAIVAIVGAGSVMMMMG
jgi:hypothetical protein